MKYSVSSLNLYRDCPQKFYRAKIKKHPPDEVSDRFYAIYGIVVQKVFEIFYNEQCWLMKGNLLPYLKEICRKEFASLLKTEYVDWNKHKLSPQQFYQECEDAILVGLGAIKQEKLLAPYAKSEIWLHHTLDSGHILNGRVDFIFKYSDKDVWILDGKGTSSQNADKWQLYFYALLYYLNYGVIPNKLGFIYWRFGTVKFVKFKPEDLKPFYEEVLQIIEQIAVNVKTRKWPANPPKGCFFCDYKPSCVDYRIYKRDKRAAKLDGDPLFEGGVKKGFVDEVSF